MAKRGQNSRAYYSSKVREIMGRGIWERIDNMDVPRLKREDIIKAVNSVVPEKSKYKSYYHRRKIFDRLEREVENYAKLRSKNGERRRDESESDYEKRLSRLERKIRTYSNSTDRNGSKPKIEISYARKSNSVPEGSIPLSDGKPAWESPNDAKEDFKGGVKVIELIVKNHPKEGSFSERFTPDRLAELRATISKLGLDSGTVFEQFMNPDNDTEVYYILTF